MLHSIQKRFFVNFLGVEATGRTEVKFGFHPHVNIFKTNAKI